MHNGDMLLRSLGNHLNNNSYCNSLLIIIHNKIQRILAIYAVLGSFTTYYDSMLRQMLYTNMLTQIFIVYKISVLLLLL